MIKAAIKLLLLVVWIFLCICLLWVVNKTGKRNWRERFCNFGFTVICVIIGLRVRVEGEIAEIRPLLLVSNHISYLDIMILGAKTPALFTPKSDVEKWPVISTICRLLGCVFINRTNVKIKEARAKMYDALAASEIISLFPEGTTGNGRHLLPFKSSLFSIAEEKINMADGEEHELFIQPAIISYTGIGALPIDSTQWPALAWYGDMVLVPHLWQLLKLGRVDVKLTFLPAVTLSQFGDRKQLATYCHDVTVEVLQRR
jgi:1-acyl-sn-glycerol-3-phosphate acyltransferase